MLMIAAAGGLLFLAHGPILTKAGELIVKKDEMNLQTPLSSLPAKRQNASSTE